MTTVQQAHTSHNPKMQNKKFKEILLEAVDEGLSFIGESAKQAVYQHLRKCGICKSEIPEKIMEFEAALNDIFGVGSKILLIKIMEKLYQKVRGNVKITEDKELRFTEYIEAVACLYSTRDW